MSEELMNEKLMFEVYFGIQAIGFVIVAISFCTFYGRQEGLKRPLLLACLFVSAVTLSVLAIFYPFERGYWGSLGLTAFILFWFVFTPIASFYVAQCKYRSGVAWGMASIFLGSLPFVVLIFLPATQSVTREMPSERRDIVSSKLWKDISWYEGFRVAWFMFWRGATMSLFIWFVTHFAITLLGGPSLRGIVSALVLTLIVGGPMLTSQMLSKQFRGFRITIVRSEPVTARTAQ